MSYTTNKDLNKVIKNYIKAGHGTVKRRNKHIKIFSNNGLDVFIVSKTPSDRRAILNIESMLRRGY